MIGDKLNNMLQTYKEIAKLHREDLVSTDEAPNWTSSFFMMRKLEQAISRDKPQQVIIDLINNLKQSLGGLKDDLVKLVSDDKLEMAQDLRGRVINITDEIKADIIEAAPSSAPKL